MTRQDIVRRLKRHEAELRGLGVERISIFGSAARGDFLASSDIDLAVKLAPGFSKGGLDYIGRFEALRQRLAQALGCPVDLIEEPAERASLQARIDEDRAVAF